MKTDSHIIGAALGRIPSGCSILTVRSADRTTGMLASWVQQASFEPPAITVCVKRGRPIAELLSESGKFVLNLLGDDPSAMFKHFGKGFSPDEDAFVGLNVEASEFGPVITACIAHLGCTVLDRIAVGDHDVYAAQIIAASAADGAKPYVHLRKNGLSY